jgi:hypothetical protein
LGVMAFSRPGFSALSPPVVLNHIGNKRLDAGTRAVSRGDILGFVADRAHFPDLTIWVAETYLGDVVRRRCSRNPRSNGLVVRSRARR